MTIVRQPQTRADRSVKPVSTLLVLWILCGCSVVALIAASIVGVAKTARDQIIREYPFLAGATLTLEAVRPSSFYITVEYKISGDPELRRADWRMKGDEVVVSK